MDVAGGSRDPSATALNCGEIGEDVADVILAPSNNESATLGHGDNA
jgi:hypothetical protein